MSDQPRQLTPKTGKSLVPKESVTQVPKKLITRIEKLEATKDMPPASIVYGAAAGAFFTFSLLLFIGHHWLDGLITLLPAALFTGFAVHIMNNAPPKR